MPNVTDTIRAQIERDIFNGGFKSGDRIDEKYMMQRFSVSRTPAREALVHLAAIGLLTLVQRKGYLVLQISPQEYVELAEILEVNESLAAKLAASRISKEQLDQLAGALRDCREALEKQDAHAYRVSNSLFHQVIYEACGNQSLKEAISLLRARMRGIADVRFESLSRMQASCKEHEAIYEAIATGDSQSAAQVMAAHILGGSGNFKQQVLAAPEFRATWRSPP
ncbi:AsnC family transcriptional regulator [Alicycliphilus denitrificans]|nr:MAG: hypothetical protein BGO66_08390 [Alicycliphilus sp. 69-12]BCN37043.1 AsnC family transcriptional regulator [Alicycliphilus denitrificans]